MKMYSLLDRKLHEFGPIALGANDEHVKRALVDSIRGSNSLAEQHPEDFDLYRLGEFNEENGAVEGHPPELVVTLAELLLPRGEKVVSHG